MDWRDVAVRGSRFGSFISRRRRAMSANWLHAVVADKESSQLRDCYEKDDGLVEDDERFALDRYLLVAGAAGWTD